MNFSFDPSLPVIICAVSTVLAVCFILVSYCARFRRVARCAAHDAEVSIAAVEDLPDVSVVVYAYDDADCLRKLLPQLLSQNYPAPFEVIVVNEGQSDATSEVVNALALEHRNLYLTFTPEGARNLSRKKLALTLGVKAARYDVVVTVDADTMVTSDMWLLRMAGHFADPECDVVIGACRRDFVDDDMRGRYYRLFDGCADTVTYLSAAEAGRPYRGTSHNLAYRRALFFENKGFSRSLNLRYGDDDIFVSEIARPDNTCVELSPESITTSICYNPRRAYREFKQRMLFTGRHVSRRAARLMGASSVAFWIWIVSAVMLSVSGLPSLLPMCFALFTAFALWIPVIISWRRAMSALGYEPLGWSLPFLIMSRPVYTFIAKVRAAKGRVHNYTWG